MRIHYGRRAAILVVVLSTAVGCSKLSPVEGTVTLDGDPLGGATLIFHAAGSSPDGKGSLREASAMTDKNGKFWLETHSRKGALAGTYRITVSRRVLPPGVQRPTNQMEAMAAEAKKVETVPPAYLAVENTPLEIEVPPGGKKDIEINLSSTSG